MFPKDQKERKQELRRTKKPKGKYEKDPW